MQNSEKSKYLGAYLDGGDPESPRSLGLRLLLGEGDLLLSLLGLLLLLKNCRIG